MTHHLDDVAAQRLAEGGLPAEEEARAGAHVARCPDCALLLESHRALAAALDGLDLPEVPADFTAGVLAEVARRERAAARDRRAVAIIGGATLAGLAVALAAGARPAWIPAATELAEQLGIVVSAFHLGAEVLPGLLGALRLPLAAACALLALPLVLTLPRLAAAPRRTH
jgi:anti-sigma factor RsiW